MKSTSFMTMSSALFLAGSVYGSADLYPENTTIRGYAKRDRLLIGGVSHISPTQIHESAGLRVKVSEEYQKTVRKIGTDEVVISTPSTSAELSYGWDRITLGLGLNYMDAEVTSDSVVDEQFLSKKVLGQLAYTISDNWTVGLGVENTWLDVEEQANLDRKFEYNYTRNTVGVAYHNEKMEFGVAYSGAVHTSDRVENDRVATLSLAKNSDSLERDIYLPITTTVYGRGNLTNNFSLLSSLSYAKYDDNVQGSVIDDARTADTLTGKISGVYWTNARSKFALAAEYQGGATTGNFKDENLLGYRLANLYGASAEAVFSFNRKAYLGALLSYKQGERNDEVVGSNEKFKEESTRVSGFVGLKI